MDGKINMNDRLRWSSPLPIANRGSNINYAGDKHPGWATFGAFVGLVGMAASQFYVIRHGKSILGIGKK